VKHNLEGERRLVPRRRHGDVADRCQKVELTLHHKCCFSCVVEHSEQQVELKLPRGLAVERQRDRSWKLPAAIGLTYADLDSLDLCRRGGAAVRSEAL